MKNSCKILCHALLALPLTSAVLPGSLWAQDEDVLPDASPAPAGMDTAPGDVEIPPSDIPAEIQDDADGTDTASGQTPPVDERGPLVDDRYNTVDNNESSFLSDIYVGPTVQVGFPQLFSYGLEALYLRTVSFGVSVNNYKVDEIDKAEIEIKGWDAHVRWHPFMGSFFVGASYGRMEVDGDYSDKFKARISGFEREVEAKINAKIETNYFTPRLGWFAVWESGLTFGFDIGAQIPLGPETSLNATFPGATPLEEVAIRQTEDYKDLKDQADEAIKVLGKRTIPVVTLLQVGWLF